MKRLVDRLFLFMLILPQFLFSQEVNSDHWAATDGLGRKLSTYNEIGSSRQNKYVGIFYLTWHQNRHNDNSEIRNITHILRQYPEALSDYDHPAWGNNKPGAFFWEEPIFGYYLTTDPWVMRKHAELLADAKIDVVFCDATNLSLTYDESVLNMMTVWTQARKDGVKTPSIAFVLPFGANEYSLTSLRHLYQTIYKDGKFKDLWFEWEGKPLIMAYPDNLTNSPEDREISGFFTFRPGQPDYVTGPIRENHWGWLEVYPQHGFGEDSDGNYEQVAVGVGQNASAASGGHCTAYNTPGTYGRDFSMEKGVDPRAEGYLYGWNFQEQWDRAFELDPKLVFVTEWNEFIAGQWLPEHGWEGDPFSFVDLFDWNRSRDIEPNKGWGDKGDVYYYQLVENIRRFKGMDKPEQPSPPVTIKIGKPGQWKNVRPLYTHYKGNTGIRNHDGYDNMHYTDSSGRNDIIQAQVARDNTNIYFMVKTAENITTPTGKHWMMLFIDIDRDKTTGWYGYDFVINRQLPHNKKAIVERSIQNKWIWEKVSECNFTVNGNILEIKIPKSILGLSEDSDSVDFEFKWNDNMQDDGNIMDFYVSGDTAPGGRFNFVYSTK